jgi:hypothetical protein
MGPRWVGPRLVSALRKPGTGAMMPQNPGPETKGYIIYILLFYASSK